MNERSLRHKFVMNPQRTMILKRRQYMHPKDRNCKQTIWIGGRGTAFRYGPEIANRKRREVACEAIVLNTKGIALCMGRNTAGTAPVPLAIDRLPAPGFDGLGPGNPFNTNPATTASATFNGTTVTLNQSVGTNWTGLLVQLPATTGFWYKVTAYTQTTLTITPPFKDGTQSGMKIRYANETSGLVDVFVIPTGYAKLHEDSHLYATGALAPNTPSPRTKCEVAGCNTGKPWLLYLPP
jgi:hypothetical protein